MSSYWLDKYNEELLTEAYPEALVVGIGSWDQVPLIYNLIRPKFISLRDTRKPLLQRNPNDVADEICAKIKSFPLEVQKICVVHGLDEEHSNRPAALTWELAFVRRVHFHGLRVIAWNIAFGNFNNIEASEFNQLWQEADYLGPHSYIGYSFITNQLIINEETCYRYRKWQDFPRQKCLPTEFGIDRWDGDQPFDGKPGWRNIGLSESTVKHKIVEVTNQHIEDGLIGNIYFTLNNQNAEWEPYYPTLDMLRFWRNNINSFRWENEMAGDAALALQALDIIYGEMETLKLEASLLKEKATNLEHLGIATKAQEFANLSDDAKSHLITIKNAVILPNL